jgi:spore coat protein CotH
VAWDHNAAFGGFGRGGGPGGPGGGRGAMPPAAPGGMARPYGAGPGELADGGPGGSNVLAERFLADETFHALYEQATVDLRASLYESGAAQAVLDAWVDVLTEQAGDLVDADTVDSEADTISAYFQQTDGDGA